MARTYLKEICVYVEPYKLTQTCDIRKTDPDQLFVRFKAGDHGRTAAKVTMAGWLKNTIQTVYEIRKLPIPQSVKDICHHLGQI